MQKQTLVIVCLVLLLVFTIFAKDAKPKAKKNESKGADTDRKTNMVLWLKYKHELIHELSRHFCKNLKQEYPCAELDKTVLQIVDEPADALWHRSRYYLNEGVCKFVPAWKSSFEPRIAGFDGEFENVYSDYLKAVPKSFVNEAAQAFVKFSMYKGESFKSKNTTKSYSWLETKSTLADFVGAMKNSTLKANEYGWQFSISRDTKIDHQHNKWGLKKLPFTIKKSFVRKVDKNNKQAPLTDNFFNDNEVVSLEDLQQVEADTVDAEESDEQIEEMSDSESNWWFFRRRSSPPPPPPKPVKPLIIKTKTFKIAFMAKGIKAIHVKPDEWFDYNFINATSSKMRKWFGPRGELSLVPRTIYVAYQPRVEIIVSESQLNGVKQDLNADGVLEWLIGGVRFSGFKQKVDKPMAEAEEDDETDLVQLEEVKEEKEEKVHSTAQEANKSNLRRKLLQPNKKVNDEVAEQQIEDEAASDSEWWFFRRRRSSPPPPPPKTAAPKKERNFKLTFASRSKTPQILGVVSNILPL